MVSADADVNDDDDAVPCDFCCSERAVVFCRADSARLCLVCDREVHAANTVSSRHNRSLLCDQCAASPASIFCSSPPHRLVLCSNCDFDAHHADDHHHDRRAVDPFSGCPSGTFLASALGLGDEKGTLPSKVEEGWDWEAPQVFSWDDLILPPTTTLFHGYQAMRIPPPRKDTNSSRGKRKEEIHRQIHKLIRGETDGIDCSEEIMPVMEFRSLPLENLKLGNLDDEFGYTPEFVEELRCEVSNLQRNLNDNQMAVSNPVVVSCVQQIGSSSLANATFVDSTVQVASYASLPRGSDKIQENPTTNENLSSMPPKDEVPDRSSVISRYKEKRKTRRYDKLIRYESRKARADTRVRIKGRFAKANQVANP